jgi:hypothetical protein
MRSAAILEEGEHVNHELHDAKNEEEQNKTENLKIRGQGAYR